MEREVTKMTRFCDSCGRKSDMMLTPCPVCQGDNCFTCSSQLYDVYHTNVCKKCLEDPDIKRTHMDIHRRWLKIQTLMIEEISLARK